MSGQRGQLPPAHMSAGIETVDNAPNNAHTVAEEQTFKASSNNREGLKMVEVLASLYLFIALFSATMTYIEQQAIRGHEPHLKALGFLACAFWPALLIAVSITMLVRPQFSR